MKFAMNDRHQSISFEFDTQHILRMLSMAKVNLKFLKWPAVWAQDGYGICLVTQRSWVRTPPRVKFRDLIWII